MKNVAIFLAPTKNGCHGSSDPLSVDMDRLSRAWRGVGLFGGKVTAGYVRRVGLKMTSETWGKMMLELSARNTFMKHV